MTRSMVWCSFSFEGFHCWPDAPDEVGFLRDRHRHLFGVKAWKEVTHDDRDVEFILLKRKMIDAIRLQARSMDGAGEATRNWSCEHWARWLLETFELAKCEVSEDGENGATLEVVARSDAPAKLAEAEAGAPHVVVNVGDELVCVCGVVFMDHGEGARHLLESNA